VVICYEAGRTSRHALLRAKQQLETAGAKILGVILNHTQPGTEMIETYPYYKYQYSPNKRDDEKK
jgi:Mrp family chromosome partitioning ATPase